MGDGESETFEFKVESLSVINNNFHLNKETFFHELINNAFKALDKIRYERQTELEAQFIRLVPHKVNKTLSIIDNGIGMTKTDLVHNLGRSSQLGVGFYSAFLVANKVMVTTNHNHHDQYTWESQGGASFIVTKDSSGQQLRKGTKTTLFLKEDQLEYLEETRIKDLVKKHFQFTSYPIYLWTEKEKFVDIVSEQFRNRIPDDLTFSIMGKLPLKSIKRFGCVCKSWVSLLENPNFMTIFRNNFLSNHRSYYDDTVLLLCQSLNTNITETHHENLFLLSGEKFQNRVKLDWPNLFQEQNLANSHIDILGHASINGILCVNNRYSTIGLWNPTTEELKIIPPSPNKFVPSNLVYSADPCGFGYDRDTDDYKVISHVQFLLFDDNDNWNRENEHRNPLWEIYSLRSNSWKNLEIDVDVPLSDRVDYLYLDGMCHWQGGDYLVSFDLSNEVFFTTPIPLEIPSDRIRYEYDVTLVLLNVSVALISHFMYCSTFNISILGEVGVKESWTKLFIVEPLPYILHSIGAGKKGDIFFRSKDDELVR
ncbi:F-box/kelch-repeat protein At3g06240 [Cajanus cajan]|uniref:F-box/kelch-repeat protein At3g06240 n=1 Tax=Cajanus cajan TaxID=3821 RepID=UPI00098D7BCE|nr:F-box/kelch-repeat protein At3g06240 [Cajanus cajan]